MSPWRDIQLSSTSASWQLAFIGTRDRIITSQLDLEPYANLWVLSCHQSPLHISCIPGTSNDFLKIIICSIIVLCACTPWCSYGGQTITCYSWFSPSAMWVLEIQLRSSDLAISTLTHLGSPGLFQDVNKKMTDWSDMVIYTYNPST